MSALLRPLLISLTIGSIAHAQTEPLGVIPLPTTYSRLAGSLLLDRGLRIEIEGFEDRRLAEAADRFGTRLSAITGVPRGAGNARLRLRVERPDATPESYSLRVSPREVSLTSETVAGALHGLETLLQLVRLGADGFEIPSMTIDDAPRFSWRGLLIDVSRHFQPVDVIKRHLDAMAAVKLNVLHWHLTDDQGFRIESKAYPRLHLLGGDGEFYTQEEIKDVVDYAWKRGIRVVPELDVPGHATSWLVGYPELASAPGPYVVETRFGIQDPTFDPTNEAVYELLDGVFGEMATLFPDPYVHIGGDEVTGTHWDENPSIQEFMREKGLADNHALQGYFNERLSRILTKHDRRMVGWDEVLQPDLPAETVVQSWRGQASLNEAASLGFPAILSFGYYLDHMFPAEYLHGVDPLSGTAGSATAAERILGGEACMWGELVTPENIDGRVWPRAAAVAERLWSSPPSEGLYDRLSRLSRYLEGMGLQHESGRRRMLSRLAGDHPMEPLLTLADVLEPVRFYARTRVRDYTTATPLNRLVDAVRPESFVARRFAAMTSPSDMRAWLEKWALADERLAPLVANNALLEEAAPLARQLSQVARIGLEALDFIERDAEPPADWAARARTALDETNGPDFGVLRAMEAGSWPAPGSWWDDDKSRRKSAELEIAVVPAVLRLVHRAAGPR